MADPTLVNGQITDAVTQANVKVLDEAPAEAMGELYQTMADSIKSAMDNGVTAQQVAIQLQEAAIAHGISLLYPFDVPESGLTDKHVVSYLKAIIRNHRKGCLSPFL